MAGRFLLGADSETIKAHLSRLQSTGLMYTVDWLGEAVLTEAEADEYQKAYLRLIPALAEGTQEQRAEGPNGNDGPAVNVSLKLSALTSRFEPADVCGTAERVGQRLRPILRAAQAVGAFGECRHGACRIS